MKRGLLLMLLMVQLGVAGQELPQETEQQWESREALTPVEEDESFLQELEQFRRHPIDLNTAGEDELSALRIVNPNQVQELIRYRSLLGKFVDIHELQAIPGWDLQLIRNVLPFVTISAAATMKENMQERLHKGEYQLLVRASQVLERSAGYSDSGFSTGYLGSPLRLMTRCTYRFKNLLQYGYLGEKDPGETFWKGKNKAGFDFNSWHFFLRRLGPVRALAIGDFTVNLGQGLIQWQGLGFGKGSQVVNIKRQSPALKPYHSSGEFGFYRGLGITMGIGKIEWSLFLSSRNLSANLGWDSVRRQMYFSSLLESGYARTLAELEDKNNLHQSALGGALQWKTSGGHLGLNAVYHRFSLPMKKAAEPYNLYSIRSDHWLNYSLDFAYAWKNIHFFGEAAMDRDSHFAASGGALISIENRADLALLYRRLPAAYQTFSADAFTEATSPLNEEGLYAGLLLRPANGWELAVYGDAYHFPWLRFGIGSPVWGRDYLAQLTWTPRRGTQIYTRFRREIKPADAGIIVDGRREVVAVQRSGWRVHLQQPISLWATMRIRVESVQLSSEETEADRGYLAYVDLVYKPALQPFTAGCRFQYFETGSYASRLYAFENDVTYASSIPAFFDKGWRYYLLFNYKLTPDFQVSAKFGQLVKPDAEAIGSSGDAIKGGQKTECRVQFFLRV